MIYPILIAACRIGSIWIRSSVGKKVLLSATHMLVVMTIIEINKNRQNDQTNY